MGILDAFRGKKREPEPKKKDTGKFALDLAEFTSPDGTVDMTGIGTISGVTREMALQLPVVIRARSTMLAIVGQLPLKLYNDKGVQVKSDLFKYPFDTRMTRRRGVSLLADDLFFDGGGIWTIEGPRDPRTGMPTRFRYWNFADWKWEPDKGAYKLYDRETLKHTYADPSNVVYFPGTDEGILNLGGAHSVIIGLRAQRSLAQAIDTPPPTGFYRPAPGEEFSEDEMREILEAIEVGRRTRRTAVAPRAIEFNQVEITSRDRLVGDSLGVANLGLVNATMGTPVKYGIPVTSNTYTNVENERTTILREDISRIIGPIEDRLSMPDIVPRGWEVRFDLNAYVRGSDAERFAAYLLGLESGVYEDINAVRRVEGLPLLSPKKLREWEEKSKLTNNKSEPAKETTEEDSEEDPKQADDKGKESGEASKR